jgi:hypothetical protein
MSRDLTPEELTTWLQWEAEHPETAKENKQCI